MPRGLSGNGPSRYASAIALLLLALLAVSGGRWLATGSPAPGGEVALAALSPVEPPAPAGKEPTPVATPRPGPAVTITPGGDEAPRLAVLRIAFRDAPLAATPDRLVAIDPPTEGVFVWDGDRALLFQPAFPGWQRGQRYQVRVNGATAGLVRDFTHAFTVEGALRVAYVIPADGDREVPLGAQLLVQFNRSVAPLTVLREGAAAPAPAFDPPLDGRGEWLNTSLYRFIPDDLRPSTTYRVRIPAGLTSAADGVLADDVTWSFTTILPAVARFEPAADTQFVEPGGPFTATFNQPMDRASVEAGLKLRHAGGATVGVTFEWSEGGTVVALTPAEPLTLGHAYLLLAPAGLRGATGGATQAPATARFSVVQPPRLVSTSPRDAATGASWYGVDLDYNNPMDPDSFEGRVSIIGLDPDEIEIAARDWSPRRISISVRLEPATTYAVRVAPGVRDRGGRTVRQGTTFSFTTRADDPGPGVSLAVPASFVTYAVGSEPVLHYHAQATDEVRFALHRLTDAEAETLLRRGFIDGWSANYDRRIEFSPAGEPLRAWTESIDADQRDELRLHGTSLGDGAPLAKGHYVLSATYDDPVPGEPGRTTTRKLVLSVVDTAIVTKLAHDELIAWVLDYDTGAPLEGVAVRTAPLEVERMSPYQSARTGGEGLAQFPVATRAATYDSPYGDHLVRIEGRDRLGVASTRWDRGASPWDIGAASYSSAPVGHVYTDRPIYRPGETVYYRAVVRDEDDASYAVPGPETTVTVLVRDPRYNELHRTTATIDALGTVSGAVELPPGAPTGWYRVSVTMASPGADGQVVASTRFTVAEFRAPEFEVEVTTAAADYVAGDSIAAGAHARFYFGGPVGDAAAEWFAWSLPTTIRVDGYEDYSFTTYDYYYREEERRDPRRASGETRTDASGDARFDVPAAVEEGEGTLSYTLGATVTDASGQAVSGSTEVTVHPATWYAGIRTGSYIGRAEEPLAVHLVSVDFERDIAPERPVTVRIHEREWVRAEESTGGPYFRYRPVDTEIQVRTVTTDGAGNASFDFAPPASGTYRLVAESTDDAGRVARAATFVWVSGRDRAPWPARDDDIIDLVADRDAYEAGDVAEVLVPAPFAGATALVTIERGRVLSAEVRTFETNSEVLRIPIEDAHIPNVYVSVVLYRPPTDDDPYPRYVTGAIELPVSTAPRRLDVRVEPDRAEARPGETVRYDVTVTDAGGAGVVAGVTVAVVDEAVLALLDDLGPSGMEAFWYERVLGVHTASSLAVSADRWNEVYREPDEDERAHVPLPRADGAASQATATMAEDADMAAPEAEESAAGADPADPRVRSDFQRTALWLGQLTTDADGTASFELRLPDNTTTWNARARAVTAATQAGEGESTLLVTQPLLVRPALPRFLRVGDSATLRTLITNRTAESLDVTVAIEAAGVSVDDGATPAVAIAAGDTAVFEWPARATAEGTAVVRFTATTGGYADAVETTLPVHLDVTPETAATGGVVEDTPAVEAVYLPEYVITGGGSLEITLQGALAGALSEELAHFKPQRHESLVQVASRVVATVAVQRVRGDLEGAQWAQLNADVATLLAEQQYEGWGWCRGCDTSVWVTGWVLLALGEARDIGAVPDGDFGAAFDTVTRYTDRRADAASPADPNEHAYLLYAIADAANDGREVSATARSYAARVLTIASERRAELTNWGRAYAILGLRATGHEAGHTALLNDITADIIASANGNHWEDPRTPGSMHNGSVRITAVVLRALIEADPDHPFIEETTRWLALARSADRWKSSVERAQGMASLGAYAALTGEARGAYDYTVRVNASTVLEGHFDVPAGDYLDAAGIALAELPHGAVSRVRFEREAGEPGRLYYGLNLRYVTPARDVEALNRGFAVSHRYSLPADPETPITSAALGEVVRVTVTVVAPADRLYVEVEDFLPAGLEPIDPQLNVVAPWLREQLDAERRGAARAGAPDYYAPWYRWYYSPWSETQLRDDRLVLRATRLPKGVHEYVYYARATAPGDFFVAPPHAAETFLPEVFGRGDSSRFTVTGSR